MSPRHQRFVEEYLVDLNASQAALRAGYSSRVHRQIGCQLLQRPEVAAAVKAGIDERGRSLRVTSTRVLLELARVAFAEPTRIAEWGPAGLKLKPHDTLLPDDKAAIQEIVAFPEGGPTRVRLHSKLRALELLARHLGLLDRGAGADGARTGEEIAASAKRAREMIMERVQRLRDAKEWSDSRALAGDGTAEAGAEAEEADGDAERDVTAADAAR
jgi:phage terminase small subunit